MALAMTLVTTQYVVNQGLNGKEYRDVRAVTGSQGFLPSPLSAPRIARTPVAELIRLVEARQECHGCRAIRARRRHRLRARYRTPDADNL